MFILTSTIKHEMKKIMKNAIKIETTNSIKKSTSKKLKIVETINPIVDTLPIVSPISNLIEFETFKHFANIKNFIETNNQPFIKLTQIAKIIDCDAKTLRQKFRKIYSIFDMNKLPQIIASKNDNEKWIFEFNEKNMHDLLKMSYMQNIKIEMPLSQIA